MSLRLVRWLNDPDVFWLDPSDTPLALGALAVQMARTDLESGVLPTATIDAALAQRFDLTAAEAREMRHTCAQVAAQAPPTGTVSDLLRQTVPEAERSAMADTLLQASGGARAPSGLARVIDRRFGLRSRRQTPSAAPVQTPTSGPKHIIGSSSWRAS